MKTSSHPQPAIAAMNAVQRAELWPQVESITRARVLIVSVAHQRETQTKATAALDAIGRALAAAGLLHPATDLRDIYTGMRVEVPLIVTDYARAVELVARMLAGSLLEGAITLAGRAVESGEWRVLWPTSGLPFLFAAPLPDRDPAITGGLKHAQALADEQMRRIRALFDRERAGTLTRQDVDLFIAREGEISELAFAELSGLLQRFDGSRPPAEETAH